MPKVAIITGGASGMGLEVARALNSRGDWDLHLLDMNESAGDKAAGELNATFHKTNVIDWKNMASVFDEIHRKTHRLDFVFANAGIVEKFSFYAKYDTDGPPPELDTLSPDILLKGVIYTVYLAQHYFRKSVATKHDKVIVSTSSCGGLYPSDFSPMYSAAKHGVVGLTRSICKHFYLADGIRVNCICPGTVRTNLLNGDGWSTFPDEYFTPVSQIVKGVLMLVDGGDMEDSKGVKVAADKAWGQALEINGTNLYFRSQPEWCDDNMRKMMEYTSVEKQFGERGVLKG